MSSSRQSSSLGKSNRTDCSSPERLTKGQKATEYQTSVHQLPFNPTVTGNSSSGISGVITSQLPLNVQDVENDGQSLNASNNVLLNDKLVIQKDSKTKVDETEVYSSGDDESFSEEKKRQKIRSGKQPQQTYNDKHNHENTGSLALSSDEHNFGYIENAPCPALDVVSINNYSPPTSQTKLDPTLLKKWTKEEACSLLCTDEEKGGAGLTFEKVKLLYDAGFDGTSIANIISTIKESGKKDAVDDCLKSFPIVPRDTMVSVVNWVDNLLNTRLYHLWSADQVKEQLCKQIGEGGAGLSADQVKPFRDYGFGGNHVVQVYQKVITIEKLLKNFTESGITTTCQFEKTCESVVNWIMNTLSKDQITVDNLFKRLDTISGPPQLILKTFSIQELDTIRENQIKGISTMRKFIPFIGVESLGRDLFEQIKERSLGTTNPRENSNIIAFTGAPGIGKTRCAFEGYVCLKTHVSSISNEDPVSNIVKHLLETPCYFFAISFTNGTRFTGPIKEENDVIEGLIQRLIKIYKDFYSKTLEINPSLPTVADFFKTIIPKYSTVYFVIDEFQHLADFNIISSKRSGLDVLCNCIGDCISVLAQSNILFIPIFSGIDTLSLKDSMRKSTYPCQYLRTTRPRFTYWDYTNIFKLMARECPAQLKQLEIDSWTSNSKLRMILNKIAGLPRLVSCMLAKMQSLEQSTLDPWKHVELIFSSSFGVPSALSIPVILAYSLIEKMVSRSEIIPGEKITFQNLEEKEYIILRDNGDHCCIALPHWMTIKTFTANNTQLKYFAEHLYNIETKNINIFRLYERNFEQLNASHLIALVESFLLSGMPVVTLDEIFKGAIISKGMSNLMKENVELVHLNYLEADSTDDLLANHLHFKKTNVKSFDRKLQFKTSKGTILTLFFQDRGMNRTNESYSDIPTVDFSTINKVINDLPSSTETSQNILVYTTTKFISDPLWKKIAASEENIILIGQISTHSKIDRNLYGIRHYYRNDLYNLFFNINIPQVIFIKELQKSDENDDIINFLFEPANKKQCLDNIYSAIPNSSTLNEFIQNSHFDVKKADLIRTKFYDHKTIHSSSPNTDKIFIDFTTTHLNDDDKINLL